MDYNWASVELYRWQYGELPEGDSKDIKIPEALRGGAKLMFKDPPSTMSVASVLNMIADWWEDLEKMIIDARNEIDKESDVGKILNRWRTSLPTSDKESKAALAARKEGEKYGKD